MGQATLSSILVVIGMPASMIWDGKDIPIRP